MEVTRKDRIDALKHKVFNDLEWESAVNDFLEIVSDHPEMQNSLLGEHHPLDMEILVTAMGPILKSLRPMPGNMLSILHETDGLWHGSLFDHQHQLVLLWWPDVHAGMVVVPKEGGKPSTRVIRAMSMHVPGPAHDTHKGMWKVTPDAQDGTPKEFKPRPLASGEGAN